MGMEAVMIGISAISTGAKMVSQMSAAEAQQNAIEMKQKQDRLIYTQKRLSLGHAVEKTLQHQQAQASVKGLDMSSPSINAMQRQTFNIGSEGFQNLKTEEEMGIYNANVEKKNVQDTMWGQLFGDIGQGASSFAQLKSAGFGD